MIGLSIATATVVGQNIVAGDWDRARAASRMAGWMSAGYVGCRLAFSGLEVWGLATWDARRSPA
jgi:Na+-driven multidrug efflux pump